MLQLLTTSEEKELKACTVISIPSAIMQSISSGVPYLWALKKNIQNRELQRSLSPTSW